MTVRSQTEIVERLRVARMDDFFGFKTEVLASFLDAEHAMEFCKPNADLSDWIVLTDVATAGAEYLAFAFDKAEDHRGISAERSVEKMTEYAWLQGRDDVVKAMDDAGYARYGVPKLVAYARAFDLPIPEGQWIENMAQGRRCEPGCDIGCGS
jgi:hypothetical protein